MVFLTLHNFELGWRCRKRRCSPWQRFTEEALVTCVWELQLLPQNSWVNHVMLDNYSIYPAFVLFELQGQNKKRWLLVTVNFRFPSRPRHSAVLELSLSAGRQSRELSPAPERREKNSLEVRNGRRKGSAFGVCAFGQASWNQDSPDAPKFAISDAKTQVVKIFHVCQLTELSWSNKDAYKVMVF